MWISLPNLPTYQQSPLLNLHSLSDRAPKRSNIFIVTTVRNVAKMLKKVDNIK